MAFPNTQDQGEPLTGVTGIRVARSFILAAQEANPIAILFGRLSSRLLAAHPLCAVYRRGPALGSRTRLFKLTASYKAVASGYLSSRLTFHRKKFLRPRRSIRDLFRRLSSSVLHQIT